MFVSSLELWNLFRSEKQKAESFPEDAKPSAFVELHKFIHVTEVSSVLVNTGVSAMPNIPTCTP